MIYLYVVGFRAGACRSRVFFCLAPWSRSLSRLKKKQKWVGVGWEKEMRNKEPEVRGWRAGAALRKTKEPEARLRKKNHEPESLKS